MKIRSCFVSNSSSSSFVIIERNSAEDVRNEVFDILKKREYFKDKSDEEINKFIDEWFLFKKVPADASLDEYKKICKELNEFTYWGFNAEQDDSIEDDYLERNCIYMIIAEGFPISIAEPFYYSDFLKNFDEDSDKTYYELEKIYIKNGGDPDLREYLSDHFNTARWDHLG